MFEGQIGFDGKVWMARNLTNSRIALVLLGVALGLLSRTILGVPESEPVPAMTIDRELVEPNSETIDIPLINRRPENMRRPRKQPSGLVPPISLQLQVSHDRNGERFAHDAHAMFEPHGEEVCASGCAASRHPTKLLSEEYYLQLLSEVSIEPMDRTNNALESLLYYGAQTRMFIDSIGTGALDSDRARFLAEQLGVTHAKIAIRVTDEEGIVRTWLDPTRVPFDRRHVFEMQTNQLQPLVTSGTIKRVGLDHIWVRL